MRTINPKHCTRSARQTHIGPGDKVIRRLAHLAKDRVVHHRVRDVKVVGILDEGPAGLAAFKVFSSDYRLRKPRHESHSPEVSLLSATYDSRSGITPDFRSIACCVTLWKKKSNVSMKRCWQPADAVGSIRL